MPEPGNQLADQAQGDRRVTLIWEVTRSIVALAVTLTALAVAAVMVIQGNPDRSAFSLLSNTLFLVVGLYFGRSGHPRRIAARNGDQEA